MDSKLELIKKVLLRPLPGRTAQGKMAHVLRPKYTTNPNECSEAATLLLLYPKADQWHFVLQKRASKYKGDKHAGQISFPGGKNEKEDSSMAFTALRETEEEIGVVSDDISILGALTPLYIPVSQFRVYPFVGYINYEPHFVIQKDEVDSLVEVPLVDLQDTQFKKMMPMKLSSHITLNDVPYYSFKDQIIWGATAMILAEFEEVLNGA